MKSLFILVNIYIGIAMFSIFSANYIIEKVISLSPKLQDCFKDYTLDQKTFFIMFGFLLAELFIDQVFIFIWADRFLPRDKFKKYTISVLKFGLKVLLFILGFGLSFIYIPLFVISFVLAALVLIFLIERIRSYSVNQINLIEYLKSIGWVRD